MVNMQQYMGDFLEDARAQINLLTTALPRLGVDTSALTDAHRAFHSLKSTAGAMGLTALSTLGQTHEQLLRSHIEARSLPSAEDIARVTTALADVQKALATLSQQN